MIIKFVRATVASCEDWTHDPWFTRPELCHWAKDAPLSICWISIGFPRLKARLMSQKYYPSESKAARHCLRMCLFNPHLHFLWVQQQLRNKLANESCAVNSRYLHWVFSALVNVTVVKALNCVESQLSVSFYCDICLWVNLAFCLVNCVWKDDFGKPDHTFLSWIQSI